jgi:hypothetical protein
MINPAWPEIAKATPANLNHKMGHDRSPPHRRHFARLIDFRNVTAGLGPVEDSHLPGTVREKRAFALSEIIGSSDPIEN